MPKKAKKGSSGTATSYMTQKAALKKLQLSLAAFRRLCILKGIYPQDPKHKNKLKGHGKIYYYTKDIAFLQHDPLIQELRDYKIIKRKITKAKARNEPELEARFREKLPKFNIEHIIRERYPSFVEAVRDLDDALSLLHVFATLAQTPLVSPQQIQTSERLCREFAAYVMKSHSLKRVFVSIKGVYYQATVAGETVTWLVPHQFTTKASKDIDMKVMCTFLDYYQTLMGFVLFKLYHSIGLRYPPVLDPKKDLYGQGGLDSLLLQPEELELPSTSDSKSPKALVQNETQKESEKRIDSLDAGALLKLENQEKPGDEQEGDQQEQKQESSSLLFSGLKFFISRETPRQSLEFVIRCFGGEVSWEGPNAPFPEVNPDITHHIVDRGSPRHLYLNRVYIQPQWIYDSVNEKILLPTSEYSASSTLPPHLSPFVDDQTEGYVPVRREKLNKLRELLQKNGAYDETALLAYEDVDEKDLESQYAEELLAERGKNTDENNNTTKTEDESEEDEEEENGEIEHLHDDEEAGEGEESNEENENEEEDQEEQKPKRKQDQEKSKKKQEEVQQEIHKNLTEIMMTKKNRRIYKGMKRAQERKQAESDKLLAKRQRLEQQQQKPQQQQQKKKLKK